MYFIAQFPLKYLDNFTIRAWNFKILHGNNTQKVDRLSRKLRRCIRVM